MSKRAKFTLITWIGESISGLQRAKISTDKTLVKDIVQVSDRGFKVTPPLGRRRVAFRRCWIQWDKTK